MSDADLTRMVMREFRMNSITLKRDALEAIVSVVRREADAEGALQLIMNTIQERLRRHGGDAVAVDRDMVAAAVEESSREEDDRRREALQIVSAFKAPSFKFNAARRSYHPDSSARPLHGTAKDKVAMLRQRFASVRQRLSRNPRFHKPVSAKAAKETPWVELVTVDALRSKEGEVATVLGMIVPATPGSATRWALEDLHSRVPLDVESCRRMPGLYTESCIVLVQGRLDEDGVFRAWNVGMPPPEARTDSLLALGVVDQYQLLRTPAEWEAASALEERDTSAQFCVFSDCSMDKDIVRARLRRCLETYDASEDVPRLIVLCGPFQSAPFGAQSGARRAFTASMNALADIFASTPNIAAKSQIVLVPAAGDPGSASVLPRAPLPSVLCEPVRRVVGRLALASNPCRILFHTQEIVVFRDNASSRMRRHCIIRPKDDADDEADAEEEGEAAATAGEGDAGSDAEGDDGAGAPSARPLTSEPGDGFSLMSGSDRAVSQHLSSTIVSQGHLCPLPLSVQPVYWAHDVGLRLFPLPDVVVLADDHDLFVREQVCGAETTVACPGSLAHGTFLAYEPASRAVIACDADAALTATQLGLSAGEASPGDSSHHEWQQSRLHASSAGGERDESSEFRAGSGEEEEDDDIDVEPGSAPGASAQAPHGFSGGGDDVDVDADVEPQSLSASDSSRHRKQSHGPRASSSPGAVSPSSSGYAGTPGPGAATAGSASSPSGWVPPSEAGAGAGDDDDDDDDDQGGDGLETVMASRHMARARAHPSASANHAPARASGPMDAGMALIDALQDDDDE